MQDNKKNISIKKIIIIVFILAMLISTSGIGYLVFSRWLSSAELTTESIAGNISDSICNQINSFMHVPEHINEMNHKIIENGILDLSDEKLRDQFFAGVLSSPKTSEEHTKNILERINSGFLNARVAAIKCSISLGSDTKISADQSLEEIMSNAENAMYKQKTMKRKSVNKDIIDTIIETLHTKRPKEKQHSIVVSELCGEVGSAMHLSEPERAPASNLTRTLLNCLCK